MRSKEWYTHPESNEGQLTDAQAVFATFTPIWAPVATVLATEELAGLTRWGWQQLVEWLTGAACADGDCTNEATAALQTSGQYYTRVVSAIRQSLGIAGRRNIAIADYDIGGVAGRATGVSGPTIPGTVGIPMPRFFVTTFPRRFDSEVKILETIAHMFADKPGVYPTQGTITLFSELPFCESCIGVIQQFQQMFPNIKFL